MSCSRKRRSSSLLVLRCQYWFIGGPSKVYASALSGRVELDGWDASWSEVKFKD
uniref:Uncharacterized protein n=1 Tax=wastewater metagenome TaxID=527639 RepID=A0A0A8KXP7_9ZZZZ